MARGLLYSAEHLAQGMFVPHVVLSRTQTVGGIQFMEFSSHLYRYIYIYILFSFFCCVSACTHTYTHIHIAKHSLTQYVVYYTYFPIRALRRPNDPCLHVSALSTGPFPRNVVVAFFCEYANISIENGYQPVTQPTTFILLSGVNWALTRAAPNPHVSRPRLAFSWHSYIHHTHQ